MAGGLTISTLNDSSGVLATQNGMKGIAKAWVQFYGGGGSTTAGQINNSFNVSSVVKNATGDFTINFTTAMPNAFYCVAGSGAMSGIASGSDLGQRIPSGATVPTASALRFSYVTYAGTSTDPSYGSIAIFA